MDVTDRKLLEAVAEGLAAVPRPYAELGARAGLSEPEAIARLGRLIESGAIKRFGVVVRHHELGYRANAMVVWDVADAEVSAIGRRMAAAPAVTLCYRRPRRLPLWPYNLFCMIHGRDRGAVEAEVEALARSLGLEHVGRAVLFSTTRFKQRGATYRVPARPAGEAA